MAIVRNLKSRGRSVWRVAAQWDGGPAQIEGCERKTLYEVSDEKVWCFPPTLHFQEPYQSAQPIKILLQVGARRLNSIGKWFIRVWSRNSSFQIKHMLHCSILYGRFWEDKVIWLLCYSSLSNSIVSTNCKEPLHVFLTSHFSGVVKMIFLLKREHISNDVVNLLQESKVKHTLVKNEYLTLRK